MGEINLTLYYHNWWPTCPCCHEPHIPSIRPGKFEIKNNEITCGNPDCKAKFLIKVDIPTDYSDIIPHSLGNCSPLFWEMKPNPIERSYLDWITMDPTPSGLYVITWPWNNVKFTPILTLKLLENTNLNAPVIIFSPNIKKIRSRKSLRSPFPNILWKYLAVLDEIIKDPSMKSARKSLFKNINNALITYETEVTKYQRRGAIITKYDRIDDEQIPTDVKNVKRYIEKRKGKLKYKKDWQHEIFTNWDSIFFPDLNDILEIFYPEDYPEIKIEGNKIVFIRSGRNTNLNKETLTAKIDNPNLIIIENIEEACLHRYYSFDFYKFINTIPKNCLVLMFSTKPRLRFLLKDLIEKTNRNIIFHCWDTQERMNYLLNNNWTESKFSNAGFSRKEEIRRDYYGKNRL